MLCYYFLRVGLAADVRTFVPFDEFIVELNAFSTEIGTSFYFNKAGAFKLVPGLLCFIAILTILGFYYVLYIKSLAPPLTLKFNLAVCAPLLSISIAVLLDRP